MRRKGNIASLPFPALGCCYRGGTLPIEFHDFFSLGKKYRAPMFVATSHDKAVAEEFFRDQWKAGQHPAVLWRIQLHPRGQYERALRCQHVNLLNHSQMEFEYLFAPYSVFTVRAVQWKEGTAQEPHIIDIDAAIDNKNEPQNLPLAPWH